MKYRFLFALALGGTVACGGEHPEAHHGGEAGEHHEEHEAKGPVADFHAVLAPVWHSDKGAERNAKMCDQAATLKTRAVAVEAAPAPEGAGADAYKANAKALTESVDALIAACAADGRPDIEAKLSAVHDAFHKVAEGGGEHHEHEHHD
jgi:hypothetical protein